MQKRCFFCDSGGWTLAWRSLAAVAWEVGNDMMLSSWRNRTNTRTIEYNWCRIRFELTYIQTFSIWTIIWIVIIYFFINGEFLGDSWQACPRNSISITILKHQLILVERERWTIRFSISSKRQMVIDGIFTPLPMSAQLLFEHGHSGEGMLQLITHSHISKELVGPHTMNAWWQWYIVRCFLSTRIGCGCFCSCSCG